MKTDYESVLQKLERLAVTPGVLMAWAEIIREGAGAIRELLEDKDWAELSAPPKAPAPPADQSGEPPAGWKDFPPPPPQGG